MIQLPEVEGVLWGGPQDANHLAFIMNVHHDWGGGLAVGWGAGMQRKKQKRKGRTTWWVGAHRLACSGSRLGLQVCKDSGWISGVLGWVHSGTRVCVYVCVRVCVCVRGCVCVCVHSRAW